MPLPLSAPGATFAREMLRRLAFVPILGAALASFSQPVGAAGDPGRSEEAGVFTQKVRPLLQHYCLKCHSTEKQKGDIDLEMFSSAELARKHPKVWQAVAEELESLEMPPEEKPQPSAEERALLSEWTGSLLASMAREQAGDPGPVVLRRLSNAEYTYTVRDLTGLDSLDPVREFPADGAAGEGFTNTGQALVMSPALLTKYFDAGKAIASHAVLLPDGIRFSPGRTRRDWTEEILGRIHAFYRRFAAAGGAEKVNLQGVVFETNGGGRLPLDRYLAALLKNRAALAAGHTDLEKIGAAEGLSPKYLARLDQAFSGKPSGWLLQRWQERWPAATVTDAPALAAEVAGWQKALWKFNSVGQIGIPGHPTAWMEPASPLATRQDFRIKLPTAKPDETVKVYLAATSLGGSGSVVWERPRVAAKGRPDVLLHDLEPELFPASPEDEALDPASFFASAPSVVELSIPAQAAADGELVVTGRLPKFSGVARMQLQVLTARPPAGGPAASLPSPAQPILVAEGSDLRRADEEAFSAFRDLFPAVLCYEKIVPSDEVITLVHFYREDGPLARLMLNEAEQTQLDRLWMELRYVSQDPLTLVDGLAQLIEFATQDANPKSADPVRTLREPFAEKAAAYRRQMVEAEPSQLQAVLDFAGRADRRPLTEAEQGELRNLYRRLREDELPHEEALRLTLAKIFVTPAFLYRGETAAPGERQAPVNPWELATRLSYFLGSSTPDAELLAAAASGQLREPEVLRAQTRRLLASPHMRRLAREFGCQWLHLADFESLDEKSDRAFPTFAALRHDMLEESTEYFTDLFQHDGSVLALLDSDYTFLNEALAKHYGIPRVTGPEWRRVEGVHRYGRGGLLGQAAVLTKQAAASRTSPILRGDFIVETLLGEKIPRPPKDVPPFPDEQATADLSVRELTEKHSADPRCARCHVRMDAFGFALENFDGIGRFQQRDRAGHELVSLAKLPDGTELNGIDGLRGYLTNQRREAFLRQFCRKLLGFALGRGVQLSDEPLLAEMRLGLQTHGYRVSTAVEAIVQSRQFLDIRGRERKQEE